MHITQIAQQLGRNDLKIIARDRFMLGMLGFVVYIGVALRYLLPWLNTYLAEKQIMPGKSITMTLADTYPLWIGYFAIFQGALMAGVIFGFLLLDEKDQGTIQAMLVTPVPLTNYLVYRITVPAIIGFFIVIALVYGIGQALLPWWQLLPLAAGASLTASIGTLFFPAVAENKVQGFAMTKFTGIIGWVILGGWFVSEPWQWLLGLFPPFWVCKAYWMALEGRSLWWLALLVGIITQLAVIYVLVRHFQHKAYR